MSQIELQDALTNAKLCLTKDDFAGVFQIADDTTRRYGLAQDDSDYREIMVHAWFAACKAIDSELERTGLRLVPITVRTPPGLRVAADDPHGIYRLMSCQERYMRQAGHARGRHTDPPLLRWHQINDWYKKRPLSVTEVVTVARRGLWKRLMGQLNRWGDRFDQMVKQAVVISHWQALHPEYLSATRSF